MRPENLTISAFGPFAEEVRIDFSALRTEGLYLITGDTGAGKTTIYDAIIFALYGEASGEYRDSTMFRSKYAKDDVKTFVELIFSYQGKRYKVRRNPEYLRPKDRGEGMTVQKAEAFLEYPDNRQPVTKYSEVTKAVTELIGLDRNQFKQIAMIAQGEFRKLLMASTKERETVFRDVFETRNYKILQERIKSEFISKNNEYKGLNQRILQFIEGIVCREDSAYSEQLEKVKTQTEVVCFDELCELMNHLLLEDSKELSVFEEQIGELNKTLTELNEQIGVAVSLEKAAKDLESTKQRLTELSEEYAAKCEAAKVAEENTKACEGLSVEIIRIQEKLSDYEKQSLWGEKLKAVLENVDMLQKSVEEKKEQSKSRTEEISKLQKIVDENKEVSTDRVKLEAQIEKLTETEEKLKNAEVQLKACETLEKESRTAKEAYRKAATICDSVKAEVSQKETCFYNAQAGILAETLEDGKPCPVCGSLEHPHIAPKPSVAPSKEELDAEKERLKEAEENRAKKSLASGKAEERFKQAKELLEDKLQADFHENDISFEEKELLQNMLQLRKQKLAEEEASFKQQLQEIEEKEKAYQEAYDRLPIVTKAKEETEQTLHEMNEELIKGSGEADGLKAQLEALQKDLKFADENAAKEQIRKLQKEKSVIELAYKKAQEEMNNCEKEIGEKTAAKNTLEEQLKNGNNIELSVLTEDKNRLTGELKDQQTAKETVNRRFKNNEAAKENIEREWKRLSQTEKEYKLLKSLSDTANGGLSGKDKIMLETYIQATYFDRILSRANIRFSKMSNGQYELVRKKNASNQRSQSGLELDVRDHYNGSFRSVQTLSGGESFMASLSLALGLSDEIQAAAGGIQLDTMFVDEGFGSLDDETLNVAIRTLNELTEGNRLVGIISHVTELKQSIDKQILVTKKRESGSSVSVECG